VVGCLSSQYESVVVFGFPSFFSRFGFCDRFVKLRSSSHDMFLKSLLVGEGDRSLRGIQSYFFWRKDGGTVKRCLVCFCVEVKNLSLASGKLLP
jgi:hypothetical protein